MCVQTMRCLVFLIASPALLLISLFGCLVWILLLPFRCICCPCACAVQLAWDVVEWLIKAPFRMLLWATGADDWKPDQTRRPPRD
ncbi:unnamed protein product [Ostreobium quekettii]|uniref:Uncharacterized protein n=1 Tax=Ostreobium quekettii TaxID=121088 RepID=A0A8S1JIF6_9CHLO|nr:unnamed protein product [Ostreobium quekettii]